MALNIARFTLLCAALVVAWSVHATKMDAPTTGQAFDLRLKQLETELRCLVCQNQTLADSNADLANDLRREVRELAVSGKTDEEIRGYLVARYGDFVLYKPPLKTTTWALWLGPFALLVGGGLLWWTILRRRERTPVVTATSGVEATERARARLDEES